VVVTTLGGGPLSLSGPAYGYHDGDTKQKSQFHSPQGCALDGAGFLYVADRDNGAIRKLDIAANATTTYIKDLTGKNPVGIAIDRTNVLYVACLGETSILKYDHFNRFTPVASPIGSGLNAPAAVALNFDADSRLIDIYVVEKGTGAGGALKRIDPVTQAVTTLLTGLGDPSGIAILDSGYIVVSETSAHRLRIVDAASKTTLYQIGSAAGFADGPFGLVRFNRPQQIFTAPNGAVVVADQGNHCVRLMGFNGLVSTVYGIDPLDWGVSYPGWWDGPANVAECREPVGVCVGTNGTVYGTETFYHIVRQAEGAGLADTQSGGTTGGGSVVPPAPNPPIVSVKYRDASGLLVETTNALSGYFPMGLDIFVSLPSTNLFFNTSVRYTTDGTDPTTNSTPVVMINNQGVIHWSDAVRDLRFLRVRAFLRDLASPIVAGHSVLTNQVGISRDVIAGVGSTLVVPVVANLTSNAELRSLQFRIDITPQTPDAPVIGSQFRPISFTDALFIPLVGFTESGKTSSFSSFSYLEGRTRRVEISFLTSNANFYIKNYGVVALMAIPIPTGAKEGHGYNIEIFQPSGTSDGASGIVELKSMPARTVLVANAPYMVGDTSPATWYNAGDFGKGLLANSDVNNAMYASMGIRSPFSFTDVFDAMDAFPLDDLQRGIAGGDGQIRFLDWQTILQRSLGRPGAGEASHYIRSWGSNGLRRATMQAASVLAPASFPAGRLALAARTMDKTWFRNAVFGVLPVENATPDGVVDVPVYLKVLPPYSIGGMQFRVLVSPRGGAPSIAGPVRFVSSPNLPDPAHVVNFASNDSSWAWDITTLNPALKGSNVLGSLQFEIPSQAVSGGSYEIHFLNADGAPDINTQYTFETFSAAVWIGVPAQRTRPVISDEWKAFYFGSYANPASDENADPDGDGLSNLEEYQAGSNPASLYLRISGPEWIDALKMSALRLRWFAAENRPYSVEWNDNLIGGQWNRLTSETGTGEAREMLDTNVSKSTRFYRISNSPGSQ
jgi:hypothetical protein